MHHFYKTSSIERIEDDNFFVRIILGMPFTLLIYSLYPWDFIFQQTVLPSLNRKFKLVYLSIQVVYNFLVRNCF